MKTKLTTGMLLCLLVMACNSGKKANKEAQTDVIESNGEVADVDMNSDAAMAKLENTKWILSSLNGQDLTEREDDEQSIYFTLNPDENRINGNTGCNTIMGSYELTGDSGITFSEMASTRMMCPDAKINESQILNIFNEADTYEISGQQIVLKKGSATLAAFEKSLLEYEPIVEKYWKLKTLEGKDVSMAENQEREIYFMLKTQENRVEGFAGCNSISGTYTLEEGNRIKFSYMATTMKACPDVDVNEADFLKLFELADNYTINDDVLSLNLAKRAPLAVFEAVYFN